jgi:hypothetical protein
MSARSKLRRLVRRLGREVTRGIWLSQGQGAGGAYHRSVEPQRFHAKVGLARRVDLVTT